MFDSTYLYFHVKRKIAFINGSPLSSSCRNSASRIDISTFPTIYVKDSFYYCNVKLFYVPRLTSSDEI